MISSLLPLHHAKSLFAWPPLLVTKKCINFYCFYFRLKKCSKDFVTMAMTKTASQCFYFEFNDYTKLLKRMFVPLSPCQVHPGLSAERAASPSWQFPGNELDLARLPEQFVYTCNDINTSKFQGTFHIQTFSLTYLFYLIIFPLL